MDEMKEEEEAKKIKGCEKFKKREGGETDGQTGEVGVGTRD